MIAAVGVALALSAAGTALAAAAPVVGQVATPDVVPWVQAGGGAAAVTGLAYIAKKMADGSLVAAPVDQVLQTSQRHAEKLVDLVEESHRREKELRDLIWAERQRNG